MPLARKLDFSEKDVALADFAKALSHPARIAILRALAEKKECICGELVTDLPLAQSTVSQHLKALKEIGLIKGEVDGVRSRYCIDWRIFERHQRAFSQFGAALMQLKANNCC